MTELKPDYIVRNIHNSKVYEVYNASKSATCLIGKFHMVGTNINVFGLFLLCDVEFLENVPV